MQIFSRLIGECRGLMIYHQMLMRQVVEDLMVIFCVLTLIQGIYY